MGSGVRGCWRLLRKAYWSCEKIVENTRNFRAVSQESKRMASVKNVEEEYAKDKIKIVEENVKQWLTSNMK